MTKRYLWIAAKYLIGFGLLAFMIWRNWAPASGGGIAEALEKPFQIKALVIAAGIVLVGVLMTFTRWYVLVRAQKLPFRFVDSLRLGSIGFYLSIFLPGAIGGDVIKAAFLAREQTRRTVAVATVIMDRALGLWGLIWVIAGFGGVYWAMGSPALVGEEKLQWMVIGAAAVIGVSLPAWLLLGLLSSQQAEGLAGRLGRIPKVGHSASEFWRAVWMYRCEGPSVAVALTLALCTHCSFAVAFYFSAQIFQDPAQPNPVPSLAEHFVFFPVGEIIQVFFPAPGGVGGAEAGYGWLYTLVGKPFEAGMFACVAYRLVTWSWAMIGYLMYQRMHAALPPKQREQEDLALAETEAG